MVESNTFNHLQLYMAQDQTADTVNKSIVTGHDTLFPGPIEQITCGTATQTGSTQICLRAKPGERSSIVVFCCMRRSCHAADCGSTQTHDVQFFFFSCCQIENRNAYPEFVIFEAVQT